MENKKWWIKFKNSNIRLIILAVASYSAGLGMLIMPEKISEWVIRGVGVVWTLEAISYTLDLYLKYLKKRKESLFINDVSQRSELLAFEDWVNKNTTRALKDGIKLSLENYKKANCG